MFGLSIYQDQNSPRRDYDVVSIKGECLILTKNFKVLTILENKDQRREKEAKPIGKLSLGPKKIKKLIDKRTKVMEKEGIQPSRTLEEEKNSKDSERVQNFQKFE